MERSHTLMSPPPSPSAPLPDPPETSPTGTDGSSDGGLDALAVVFPGQGSQVPGAGLPWVDHPAWSVVEEAEEVTGQRLQHLLLDPDADLSRTADSQLAVLLASLVVWEAARPLVDHPVAFAGHSLGQITALVASGAVSVADGVRLAVRRAEVTQQAADDRPGGLVALLGATVDQARQAVAEVDEAWIAHDNAPGQVVLGGTADGLAAATAAAKEAGVRKARPLPVGGAFHTPLMAAAAEAFHPEVEATTFSATTVPIVTNHDAAAHYARTGWADRLTVHLVRPVRWRESVDTLAGLGARTIVELGPGTTLSGLVKRCRDDVAVTSAATPAEVDDLLGSLFGVGVSR
jgi:[acyl-carrier-protein] S-malonyltransferase